MTTSEIPQHFNQSLGRILSSGGNAPQGILSHIRVNSHNSNKFIQIHLGLDMVKFGNKSRQDLRTGIREYFKNYLGKNETIRCLLDLRNEPRIDLALKRTTPLLSAQISNKEVKALIEYWCQRESLGVL